MRKNYKGTIEYCVIGLGRFGTALALSLADAGKEVLVLDNSETKIKEMSKYIDNAFIMSHYDKDSLMEAGVQNCHTVIVGVGSQIEVSIMTTMNLIELGVPRVIAKCVGSDHGNVLKKLGAEVVFPEKDMAVKLARSLVGTRAMDYIDLSETISIEEHAVTDKVGGQNLVQLNLRQRFDLSAIAIIKSDGEVSEVKVDEVLKEGDTLVAIGRKEKHQEYEYFLYN